MSVDRTIVLLFTTFPVATETFLQREVEALRALGARLELWSLWKGAGEFDGLPVRRPSTFGWTSLFWWVPYWLLRRPVALARILRCFFRRRPPNRLNFAENLLGLGLALRFARTFERRRDEYILHAVWASLPATFAWVVSDLLGRSFTFGAHAYDLFEDGGDWFLPVKCRSAAWIRTSTVAGAARLHVTGAPADRVDVIRRGLLRLPSCRVDDAGEQRRPPDAPLQILSVGRLVPKMGYAFQLEVYRVLRARGLKFKVAIIGGGPERASLQRRIDEFQLEETVTLHGAQPFRAVEERLGGADVALFTGVVAPNGDQAGFPNFLGEAMAAGVPIVATPVGGVAEVVVHGENGLLADTPESVADAVLAIVRDSASAMARARKARQWVEESFATKRNMRLFLERLRATKE